MSHIDLKTAPPWGGLTNSSWSAVEIAHLEVNVFPIFAYPESMVKATHTSLSISTCPTHDDNFPLLSGGTLRRAGPDTAYTDRHREHGSRDHSRRIQVK